MLPNAQLKKPKIEEKEQMTQFDDMKNNINKFVDSINDINKNKKLNSNKAIQEINTICDEIQKYVQNLRTKLLQQVYYLIIAYLFIYLR